MTRSAPSGANLFSIIATLKTKEVEFFAAVQRYMNETELGSSPKIVANDPVFRFQLMFRQIEALTYHLLFDDGVGGRLDFYERNPVTNDVRHIMTAKFDRLGNFRTKMDTLPMSVGEPNDIARFMNELTNALLTPQPNS